MCNEMFGIHIIKILSYISPSRIYFIIISQCAVKTRLNILTLQYHYYKPISHLQLTLKSTHLMLLTLLYCPTCLLMGMSPWLMACSSLCLVCHLCIWEGSSNHSSTLALRFQGQRSQAEYNPWDHKELDTSYTYWSHIPS